MSERNSPLRSSPPPRKEGRGEGSKILPLSDFDFSYPEELLATTPADPRDHSRLMAVDRRTSSIEHRRFFEIGRYLRPGDCLVLNRTKVLACRLLGQKSTGGRAEILLVKETEPGLFLAMGQRLKKGQRIELPEGAHADILEPAADGALLLRLTAPALEAFLREHGLPPLPPYILKAREARLGAPAQGGVIEERRDAARYQTVYAQDPGSIAAPTAGLHFTQPLIDEIRASGVRVAEIALHVGLGTFKPVTVSDASLHRMLPERYRVDPGAADAILSAAAGGGRVVAVGTSVVRTLETLARRPHGFSSGEGETDLYLHPGDSFKIVSGLVTNFHLPRSTPLLLASAFLGRERLLACYQEAFRERYRLFSYGDAMIIL